MSFVEGLDLSATLSGGEAQRMKLVAELTKVRDGVAAEADWVIDLGPEGGVKGGAVVGESAPEGLVANTRSHTGRR